MRSKSMLKLVSTLTAVSCAICPLGATAYEYKSATVLSPAPIFAKNGMVSSNHPIATLVGLNTLQRGGNAFDAAVATALALTAVDMAMCGPAGGSFWLLWDAKNGKLHAVDAGTQAPAAATPDKFKDRSELLSGVKAIGIPGNLKAYGEVLEKFGTMKFADVVQPTLQYLEEGFVLTQAQSNNYKRNAAQALVLYPNLARVFAPSGEWGNPGTLIKNPELANTYRTIAKEGVDAFYKGSIAREMVDYVQKNNGLWTMEDLANYRTIWTEPLSMKYRNLTVYGAPPPSSAVTWMEMLKIAEGFDWSKTPDNSAEYLHRMVEIARLAQADSYQYVSDPRFVTDRSKLLLSDNYAQAQRQRINPNKATTGKVQPGDVVAWSEKVPAVSELPSNMQTSIVAMEDSIRDMNYRGNTNHVVVTDKWGNAVSFTHTLGQFFGAQDVLGSTGVIGNNGMDWFDLDKNPWTEKASNLVVAPNKRNRWTLSPGMVFKNNKPYILVGGSGAESTMSGIFQTLIRVLEYKLNPQAAISSPRFLYGDMYHYTAGTRLHVEPELRGSFEQEMIAKGYDVVPGSMLWRMSTGNVWMIEIDSATGTFAGANEIRGDGHTNGY